MIRFIAISILIHLLLIFSLNKNILFQDTKNITKNKDKNITKIKFIDLPDDIKEKKHNKKTKYIAQKSFEAEKNKKKENPVIKPKPLIKPKPKPKPKLKPKVAIVQDKIIPIPLDKVSSKSKKVKRKRKKQSEIVKKQNIKKSSKKGKKNFVKKEKIVALNKITPTYQEMLEKGLIPEKTLSKKPILRKKIVKNRSKSSKSFKEEDVQKLSPNIFRPSHIYPDDIDISDSVSISTQSSRFASYLHKVKRKIELVWEYPRLAGEMGIGGRLFVKFTIDKTGRLVKVELLKSSGASILDREAVRAIKDAAPYPPFPEDNSFGVNKIKIHACFEYVISGKELW